MPKLLNDIQLWEPDRSAQIPLPAGETVKGSLVGFPKVTRRLGGVDEMTLTVKSGCVLAIATQADAYELSQGKIIRFVYDDSSIQEWRIKTGSREFSGQDDVKIISEPIEQDLKDITVRKTLANGHTRASVSFYNQTFQDIATNLLSSEYNCPDLFTLGTVAAGLNDTTYNVVLNAAYVIEGLKKICQLAEAEWDITYNATNDNYEINFYEAGQLGGGEAQAADRPIAMGGGKGNRLTLEKRDETEEYFSRVVPLMGEGSEIQTIAGARWRVDTATYNNPDSTVTLKENAIAKDGYGLIDGQTIYFGNQGEGWFEVTATTKPKGLTLSGDASGLTHGYFREGANKNEIVLLEDADALGQVGLKEEKFQRPDIPPYSNLIEDAGISPTLSDWSGGLPVGFQKIDGSETVSEATADIFVKHGTKSAKVSCNQDQGLQTNAITLEPEDLSPYFSTTVYLQVETGSVRVELIDGTGEKHPKDKLAETDVKETRAIKIGGTEPAAGNARIKIIAQADNTVFYVDAITLTQSAAAIEYAPLMGPKALWVEAGKHLKKYGGDRPDVWSGEVMDDAFFESGSKEIEVGSFVKVQEDWNEDTSTYDTEFTVRVVEVSYQEDRINSRYKKTVRLADKNSEAARIFQEQYLTVGSQQSSLQVREVPQKPVIDIDNAVVEGGTPRFEQVEVYPSTAKPPLVLGSNAQGELVTGFNADMLDGYHESAFVRDLTGTINQVQVTGLPDGSTNLSTPQDIHEDAEMLLRGLTIDEILGYLKSEDLTGWDWISQGFGIEKDSNGDWNLVVDNLTARKRAKFFELLFEEIMVFAKFLLNEGNKVDSVEQTGDASWSWDDDTIFPWDDGSTTSEGLAFSYADHYKNYVDKNTRVQLAINDLVQRQSFSGTGVGVTQAVVRDVEHGEAALDDNSTPRWFEIAIDNGDPPTPGQTFARLGNTTDTTRQGGLYFAGSGTGAPNKFMYDGVYRFDLFGAPSTIKSYEGNVEGRVFPNIPELDGSQPREFAHVIESGYFSGKVYVTGGNAATKDYVDANSDAGLRDELNVILDNAVANGTTIIEGGYVRAQFLQIGSGVDYDPGYDPSTKETPSGAQAKADSAQSAAENYADTQAIDARNAARDNLANELGYGTYSQMVNDVASNGSIIASGGFLRADLIDVDQLLAKSATVTNTLTIGSGGQVVAGSGNWSITETQLTAQNASIEGDITATTGDLVDVNLTGHMDFASGAFISLPSLGFIDDEGVTLAAATQNFELAVPGSLGYTSNFNITASAPEVHIHGFDRGTASAESNVELHAYNQGAVIINSGCFRGKTRHLSSTSSSLLSINIYGNTSVLYLTLNNNPNINRIYDDQSTTKFKDGQVLWLVNEGTNSFHLDNTAGAGRGQILIGGSGTRVLESGNSTFLVWNNDNESWYTAVDHGG